MPTSKKKVVVVNGETEKPIRKVKIPPGEDWQAEVRRKQKEAESEPPS